MINASNFTTRLGHVLELWNSRERDSLEVVIPVKKLHATIGGTPNVSVISINSGFDWDNGKLFITPEKPVMLVEDYDMASETIRKLQKEVGNLHYEISGFKAQIATLKRKLKEIENEK
jgi:hypothetical protein